MRTEHPLSDPWQGPVFPPRADRDVAVACLHRQNEITQVGRARPALLAHARSLELLEGL